MMMGHIRRCFDSRLISIHPTKHMVRSFVPYDLLMGYHGRKVNIPQSVDQPALQHHWDMCCLENVPLWSLPTSKAKLSNIAELLGPAVNTSRGDPSIETFPPASVTQATDTQASDNQAQGTEAPDTQASDMLNFFLASAPQACLPSPPPSEPGSDGHKTWRFGDQIVDTGQAAELWRQGHDVTPIGRDIDDTDEVRSRSRSPVLLGDHEGPRWGLEENKKQRFEY